MTDKLQQIIKAEIGKLPLENQKVLNDFGWEKMSEEIGVKYELDEVTLNNVQVEILLALVGVTDLEFFPINIENQAELIKPTAEKLAREIIEKIFIPIQNILLERIKSGDKTKSTDWRQNVDFVVSGGDYSAFLEKPESEGGLQ